MCASLLEMIYSKEHQIIAGHARPADCAGLRRACARIPESKPAIVAF